MSQAAFARECEKRGFRGHGVLGYYDVGHNTSVSILNAGPRRRDRLAYLIKQAGRVAIAKATEVVGPVEDSPGSCSTANAPAPVAHVRNPQDRKQP
jgi:hypothetical protein